MTQRKQKQIFNNLVFLIESNTLSLLLKNQQVAWDLRVRIYGKPKLNTKLCFETKEFTFREFHQILIRIFGILDWCVSRKDIAGKWCSCEKMMPRLVLFGHRIKIVHFLGIYHSFFWCNLNSKNLREIRWRTNVFLSLRLPAFPCSEFDAR